MIVTDPLGAGAQAVGRCGSCRVRPISVCGALDAGELRPLAEIAQQSRFAANESLFAEGDPAASVFSIVAGTVRLYRLLPDGRRQIVGFALPGDFLGLDIVHAHTFSADAVEPVTACRFSRAAYSRLVDETPHLLRRLHDVATHELSLARDHMLLLGRRTAEEKVAHFLLSLRDRYAAASGTPTSPHVRLPMGRQDIADFLGLTIETVSRTFTRLAREKRIVVVPDGVRLIGLECLENAA